MSVYVGRFFYVSEIAGEFHGHLGVGWILIEKKEGRNCS